VGVDRFIHCTVSSPVLRPWTGVTWIGTSTSTQTGTCSIASYFPIFLLVNGIIFATKIFQTCLNTPGDSRLKHGNVRKGWSLHCYHSTIHGTSFYDFTITTISLITWICDSAVGRQKFVRNQFCYCSKYLIGTVKKKWAANC